VSDYSKQSVVPVGKADGTLFFPAGAPRAQSAWSSIDYRSRQWATSTYNSLRRALMKRYSDGYQIQLSYTLSKDDGHNDRRWVWLADLVGLSAEFRTIRMPRWAPSIFDVRHVFAPTRRGRLPSRSNMAARGVAR
jgi:hypothetical protein